MVAVLIAVEQGGAHQEALAFAIGFGAAAGLAIWISLVVRAYGRTRGGGRRSS